MSTYNADLTWEALVSRAGSGARGMITQLTAGLNAYNEWQSFRAGRTNAQIAAALPPKVGGAVVTEAEVADMDACQAAFLELFNYADNDQSPFSADRFFSMRKFS